MSATLKGPNPLLQIGHIIIVKDKKKKSAPEYIKEALKHNKGGYNHPVGEVSPASEEKLHTCQSCINKEASTSLRHTTHLLIWETSFGIAVREGERVAHLWERIFCISLSYLLALYWLSIIRKCCWVFFPRGFPRINVVSLVIVYFSMILYYAIVIYWNAKNYNNGLNINMESEPSWRKHLSQEKNVTVAVPAN